MKPMRFRSALVACVTLASVLPAQVIFNPNPSRVVGHPHLQLSSAAPNLVEGREFSSPEGIAADTSVSPPILYVADSGNSRVLAWRSSTGYASGAPADLVIGQKDQYTTSPQGPATSLSTGLAVPTGLVVDKNGNLYVADSGNNRVLRFPQPFSQPAGLILPDLVIGQKTFNANNPNEGNSAPSAKSLSLAPNSSTVYLAGLAIDSQANLYVADAGNNRVLRYPAAALGPGAPNEPSADVVLGQPSFDISQVPFSTSDVASRKLKNGMVQPAGLALDQRDRLFVCDGLFRVLVYVPPFVTGKVVDRVMGVTTPAQGQTYQVTETSFYSSTTSGPPNGVFTINNLSFVIDTGNHRILRFQPYDQWTSETVAFSPPANGVLGQADFTSSTYNRGLKSPDANTFSSPVAAVFAAGQVHVVDTANHRMLTFDDPSTGDLSGYSARRVLGQDYFQFGVVNLVEGREMNFAGYGGVAVDLTSNPPVLYVADTWNNRVLGFRDVRKVKPGDKADLVIGQGTDSLRFYRTTLNYPNADATQPSQTGLFHPLGLAVDSEGNLWVADGGNGRVLRFPRPFVTGQQAADIVLGQSNFTTSLLIASARTMATPYGLAFSSQGHLLVSDIALSRVLVFQRDPAKGFQNGQSAVTVFGQADFNSSLTGATLTRLNQPRHIAMDSGDRLYVCDTGNNRVSIFGALYAQPQFNATAADALSVGAPNGVFIDPDTRNIWVTDPNNNRTLRFPDFDNLRVQNYTSNGGVLGVTPLAIALDAFGNVIVADAANRVALYFPGLYVTNAANGLQRVAPGMIGSLWPAGISFGSQTVPAGGYPLPTTLSDIQVLVDNVPAPLYFVSPGQINLQVPSGTRSSGTAEFQVIRPSTGQILADLPVNMELASPGFFTVDNTGSGQAAALNQDNTVNSASNAIPRGQIIQLFLTGAGVVPNAPPDGQAVQGLFPTTVKPMVAVGTSFVPADNVTFSGLAPNFAGAWQINVKIPDLTGVGSNIGIGIQYQDRSALGYLGKPVTISVK